MSIVTGTHNANSQLCSTINQEKTSQHIELDDLAVVVLDKHQPACEKAKVDAGADSPLLDKEASYSNTEKWDKEILGEILSKIIKYLHCEMIYKTFPSCRPL
jgi:hypothetical protein